MLNDEIILEYKLVDRNINFWFKSLLTVENNNALHKLQVFFFNSVTANIQRPEFISNKNSVLINI